MQAAEHWFRLYLASFGEDAAAAQINFRLAELLNQHGRYLEALDEYERTAWSYAAHSLVADAALGAQHAGDAFLELKLNNTDQLIKLNIFPFEQDITQSLFHGLGYCQHVLEPVLTDEIVRLEKNTQFQLFIGVASDMYDIALSKVDTAALSGGRYC